MDPFMTGAALFALALLIISAVAYGIYFAYKWLRRIEYTDPMYLARRFHHYMMQTCGHRKCTRYSVALLTLLAVAFAYYVWPTPWRYLPYGYGQTNRMIGTAMRVHRITGRTQVFYPTRGWSPEYHGYPFFSKLWRKVSGEERRDVELKAFAYWYNRQPWETEEEFRERQRVTRRPLESAEDFKKRSAEGYNVSPSGGEAVP